MSDALDLVWRRAEIANHVLSAAEIARWPSGQRDAIINLGLLRRTSDATALICDDCGTPHPAEVIRDPRKPHQPYYLCPEIGRVPLAPTDLQRWEADFDQVAALIREAIRLTSKAATLVMSRIWLLGRQRIGDRYWELFLMRGLCWPDGIELSASVRASTGTDRRARHCRHSRRHQSGEAGELPLRTTNGRRQNGPLTN